MFVLFATVVPWGPIAVILASVIGAGGTVFAAKLRSEAAEFRKENSDQHTINQATLERIEGAQHRIEESQGKLGEKVDGVAGDLTGHLQWHLEDNRDVNAVLW